MENSKDLSGSKIRTGKVEEEGLNLVEGQKLTLTTEDITGKDSRVSVNYKDLPGDVKVNDRILLADGLMEIEAEEVNGNEIICRVITGGILTSNKGINLPGTKP